MYQNLTRGLEDTYGREKEQLDQTLANRGITPGQPGYENQMRDFERRYDEQRAQAHSQAVQQGGQELSNEFGMQETLRGNQYGEQSGTRNQQLAEAGGLSTLGTGAGGQLANTAQSLAYADYLKKKAKEKTGGGGTAQPPYTGPVFANAPQG